MDNICVLIPVYNNHTTIERVIRDAMNEGLHVIVVNDGSTDGTTEILATIEGITLISYGQNKGKGYALKTGMTYARKKGYNYCITMDADGQHYAKDVQKFVAEANTYPGSLIVGERNLEGVDRSKGSSFANKFSNFWFAIQTGHYLRDTQTGYRLYPLRRLPHLSIISDRYEAELTLMVFAAWHGVRLRSVKIDVYYPPRNERVSHFCPAKDFARISLLNTVLCLLAVIYGLPLSLLRHTLSALRTIYTIVVFSIMMFLGVLPFSWIYAHCGKMSEKKRLSPHRLIQKTAHFAMEVHGIPGVQFTKQADQSSDFTKPQVIIANHQSHLDLLPILLLHHKIVFLTNDWVIHNPFYGYLIRQAEFISVSNGYKSILPQIHDLVNRGYSIAVFPEGTRSENCSILRFQQGAFYLADQLQLPITPILIHGSGLVLPKKSHILHRGKIRLEVHPSWSRTEMKEKGDLIAQRKWARKYYIKEYQRLKTTYEY